jgi:transcriptional regulator with XRE-family HTH domain
MTTTSTSEHRRFTPAEIAMMVKLWRAHLNWSQEALAAEANVTTRTLQRAESGEKVSDAILVRIAKALGMNEPDALTKVRLIESLDEMERRVRAETAEFEKKNWLVPSTCAASGHELMQWLLGISAWNHSTDDLQGDVVDHASALLDLIGDIVLFDPNDLSPSDRIEMAQSMDVHVKRLTAHGLKITICNHRVELKFDGLQKPWNANVGYLKVSAVAPTSFVIPKNTAFSMA